MANSKSDRSQPPLRRRRSSLKSIGAQGSFADPSQPSTWNAQWTAAFRRFEDDGEIRRENLGELLRYTGHRSKNKKIIESVAKRVSSLPTLSAAEVYDFIFKYRDEMHQEIVRIFNSSAESNGGKVPVAELGSLIQTRGYTPTPHVVREVLQEALQKLGEDNIGDGVTLRVFETLLALLEKHEGFCKSDLDILEGAFLQFDKNNNGYIDSWELQPALESLDFCLDDGIIKSLAADVIRESRGTLSFTDFLGINSRRVHLEFDHCRELFARCVDNTDNLLRPAEIMRLFSRLGIYLLPETLSDLIDECELDDEATDFNGFWHMLQVLRMREGWTSHEAADIHEVFQRFDSTGRHELPLKRIPAALTWLGYQSGPGVIGKANKQVEIPSTGNGFMNEAQFMRLVRKHREAQLKVVRKVYRAFAEDGGVGKLHMENLQAAVTRLNRLFVNDFVDWVKMFRPGARLARKQSKFDFEEFRIIVLHCCDKLRARIQRNCGYSEVQLSRLRIEFVKHTREGSSTDVDAPGLMKLFKALLPQAQTSPAVRNRLKTALERNAPKTKCLDWHAFLRVMQAYDELTERDSEMLIEVGIHELQIPDDHVDRAQEILANLCQGGRCALTTGARSSTSEAQLTVKDVLLLVRSIAPRLSEAEAEEALEQFLEAEKQGIDGEFSAAEALKNIVLEGDLVKRSDQPKAHDLAGTS